MSIAQVVTFGFGTFGSVNKLPTMGFDIGEASTATDTTGLEYNAQSVLFEFSAKSVLFEFKAKTDE